MINKLDIIAIFFVVNFLSISFCFQSELIHIVKSKYLLVNENDIFQIKNLFGNEIEKIDSINEDQNTSDAKKNIKNIYKVKCFEDNFCIFINNFLYIFKSEGNFIKRIKISEKNIENKYIVLSCDSSLKEINIFNYIISHIDERGYFVTNFYKYKFPEDNAYCFKSELNLKKDRNIEVSIKENDFACQLITNSIYCFFSDANSNEMIVKNYILVLIKKKLIFQFLLNQKIIILFSPRKYSNHLLVKINPKFLYFIHPKME